MKKILAIFLIVALICTPVFADEELTEEVTEEITDEIIEEAPEDGTEDVDDTITEDVVIENEDDGNSGGEVDDIAVPDGITVKLNGKIVKFDAAQPKMVNSRVLVPMRKIFETVGAEVSWDETTYTASATKEGIEVKISIGSHIMYKNGVSAEIDVPAQIFYNRTYVPVRFITEAFGAEVSWDGYLKTVNIQF